MGVRESILEDTLSTYPEANISIKHFLTVIIGKGQYIRIYEKTIRK